MQRESIRALLTLVAGVSTLAALVCWALWDGRLETAYSVGGWGGVAALACTTSCFMRWRKDRVPDFLAEHFDQYFEKRGLCFNCVAEEVDGQGILKVFVQNRYQGKLFGTIALRPQKEMHIAPYQLSALKCDVECPGGAFGVLNLPFFLATEHQGVPIRFDIGADVEFVEPKGKLLRFRDGIAVELNASFKNHFDTVLKAAALLAGIWASPSHACATLTMPYPIKESADADPLDASRSPTLLVLWPPE